MKRLRFAILGVGLAGALCAQNGEMSRFSFNAGAGFTTPVGGTSRRLDTGWNLQGGAGVNFIPHVGAMLQFNYNDMGINRATLDNLGGIPGGSVRIWSLTLNPVVHLNPKGKVDAYIIGGGGIYHRTQEFTEPAISFATAFDPFFGFYDVAVPVNQVIASRSVMKPGVNIGAGLAFGSKWKGKFYAEARYHRMMFRNSHTDYIPVNFGYRF
jgi:hypothetical protein